MKVVCDDKIPFLKGVLEPYAEVVYLPGNQTTPEVIADADALITRTRTQCNQKLLDQSGVKFIGTATIGFDHIQTEWVESKGIVWTNSPGCNSGSVKQYVAASISALILESGWNPEGKTMGIVGVGNVGSKVKVVAEAFGMKVLLNDPPRQRVEGGDFVSMDTLLESSDLITFHVPLTTGGDDNTFHLVDNQCIGRMKKGVILLNSSRGEVVSTDTLKAALRNGMISRAIIDVWENEPLPDPELLSITFIGTPHIAGYSMDGKANGTAMVVQALSRFFHLPLNNWFPKDVPVPPQTEILIDCNGKQNHEIMAEAILSTYPIREDDQLLKSDRSKFEELRGSYRLRREFGTYQVHLKNGCDEVANRLRYIGFGKVING